MVAFVLALLPPLHVGLLVAPPQLVPAAAPLAATALQHQQAAAALAPRADVLVNDVLFATNALVADASGKWLNEAFDTAAAAAIPFILLGLLYLLFRLAKLFGSAF